MKAHVTVKNMTPIPDGPNSQRNLTSKSKERKSVELWQIQNIKLQDLKPDGEDLI